ncbi:MULTISPECIES: DUF3291 domain-containing protein [Actinomadura]|uniref:DUF3291 domain-containing protein n=1 Tax=Actinomadura yumaensis TaxID=111807 RepID=A0ABW2D1T8_9ACTN|nr:DUF3291 domain-containing protein [Actinomadura sp. J1-007]MWK39305.1 DUF3291 domain-containing protein [Actinomadura sp. J1-007]
MSGSHLAQFNVATLRFPLDDPRLAEFVARLDPVNAAADGAPGFVWRLTEEGRPDATGLRPLGDDVIINFSVWEDREALWDFAYRSGHLELLRRRREWFQRHAEAHSVLWWIPAGHVPTVEEAAERLALLRAEGPSPRAFTFNSAYTAEEAAEAERSREPGAGAAGEPEKIAQPG